MTVNNNLLKNTFKLKKRIIITVQLKSRQATLGYTFEIIAHQAIIFDRYLNCNMIPDKCEWSFLEHNFHFHWKNY